MKPKLKTLTWSDFDQHKPCYSPQKKYGVFSGTILDILKDERIPNVDKIWAFTREGVMDDKALRLFAARCARRSQYLMKDPRSINALDVAERHANGLATAEELEAAEREAWKAEMEARKAERAAMDTVWTAAWAAARGEREAALAAARAAARDAALAAEWAAEWGAAREVKIKIAINLINEFYEP